MTLPRLAAVLLTLGPASAAVAQPAAAPAPAASTSPAAAPALAPAAPVNDQAAQDRIMALVRARKCGAAKAEATRVGDLSLADQIEAMCGARSSNPFPTKAGGAGQGQRRGGRGG